MANTVVSICNLALVRIGATRISALTDDSKSAILCNAMWEPSRDEVLSEHFWNCASARQTLAQDSTAPAFRFDYRYPLPTNPYCLSVRALYEDDDESDEAWSVEGRYLLTNLDDEDVDVNIEYTKQVADPTEFSAWLVYPLALRLASHLAYAIAESNSLKNEILQEYEAELLRAREADAREKFAKEERKDPWSEAGRN